MSLYPREYTVPIIHNVSTRYVDTVSNIIVNYVLNSPENIVYGDTLHTYRKGVRHVQETDVASTATLMTLY